MNLRLFCRCFSKFLHSRSYKASEGKNTVYLSRICFVLCKLKIDLDNWKEGMEGF